MHFVSNVSKWLWITFFVTKKLKSVPNRLKNYIIKNCMIIRYTLWLEYIVYSHIIVYWWICCLPFILRSYTHFVFIPKLFANYYFNVARCLRKCCLIVPMRSLTFVSNTENLRTGSEEILNLSRLLWMLRKSLKVTTWGNDFVIKANSFVCFWALEQALITVSPKNVDFVYPSRR